MTFYKNVWVEATGICFFLNMPNDAVMESIKPPAHNLIVCLLL